MKVSGPEGVVKITESNGKPTLEGRYHLFHLMMDSCKKNYKEDNQFPDDVTKLFDLYISAWRLKLNQASKEAILSKLEDGTNLVDKILRGFEDSSRRDDFLQSIKKMMELVIN